MTMMKTRLIDDSVALSWIQHSNIRVAESLLDDMNLSFEEFLQATYEGAIKKTLSKA